MGLVLLIDKRKTYCWNLGLTAYMYFWGVTHPNIFPPIPQFSWPLKVRWEHSLTHWQTWGSFHPMFVTQNSNSMKILFCYKSISSNHITTKFCTCHDSIAAVTCTKFCSDNSLRIWMIAKGRKQNHLWNGSQGYAGGESSWRVIKVWHVPITCGCDVWLSNISCQSQSFGETVTHYMAKNIEETQNMHWHPQHWTTTDYWKFQLRTTNTYLNFKSNIDTDCLRIHQRELG